MTARMRCDSHVHIVGPVGRYPQAAERTYLADVATLKQLERVSASRAIRRFVIVQPSFYGTDNRMLFEGLDALAGRGRGVAVINPETTSARTLSGMASQGVRGLPVLTSTRLGALPSSRDIDAAVRSVIRDALSLYAIDERALGQIRGKKDPEALRLFEDFKMLFVDRTIAYAGHSLGIDAEATGLLIAVRDYLVKAWGEICAHG